MRTKLLGAGAKELSYEIRDIVKRAEQVEALGYTIYWENIGDPVQKKNKVPDWMKEIVRDLLKDDLTYGYTHSKGELKTRQFLAERTNALGGVQIDASDILFFNGLGDAINKIYQYLTPTARVIGPSPAYSTHSSAEAAHAGDEPLTYKLDPNNNWYPDLDDLRSQVKYNPSIVGILIINPDNPTGMVYPIESLKEIVAIAKEYNLFLISDEIYNNITYNGIKAVSLAEVIGDVPGIALKGISKELPWPGSRCGWAEYYNRGVDAQFDKYCATLDNSKMIEVCSTTLPQKAIPIIFSDERFMPYRKKLNESIGKRSELIIEMLGEIPELFVNRTNGAFYNTIIFKEGVLKPGQKLKIEDKKMAALVDQWMKAEPNMNFDKRFVYYLLATTGICVVPVSSFCSDLKGFRITILEEDENALKDTFSKIGNAIREYLDS